MFITKKEKNVFSRFLYFFLSIKKEGIFKVVLFSCLMGILAQIKIPLYFTPVPLTMGTFFAMFIGASLGSYQGALTVSLYLIQGLLGLPVWAGGASGFAYFMGPTGGYLLGYVVQAYIVGLFLEKSGTFGVKPIKLVAILSLSVCLQLAMGTLWLAHFVGFSHSFALGFFPFILGEGVKVCCLTTYFLFRRNKK